MPQPRRRLLLALALLTCVLAGGVAWLLLARETAITRENAAKIENGMTQAEVEAILGGPARNDAAVHPATHCRAAQRIEANRVGWI
jgi:outer membrane protein assembly factor BamE (lipoprotein component of BamABCDE complex)